MGMLSFQFGKTIRLPYLPFCARIRPAKSFTWVTIRLRETVA